MTCSVAVAAHALPAALAASQVMKVIRAANRKKAIQAERSAAGVAVAGGRCVDGAEKMMPSAGLACALCWRASLRPKRTPKYVAHESDSPTCQQAVVGQQAVIGAG